MFVATTFDCQWSPTLIDGVTHRSDLSRELGVTFVMFDIVHPDDDLTTFELVSPVITLRLLT